MMVKSHSFHQMMYLDFMILFLLIKKSLKSYMKNMRMTTLFVNKKLRLENYLQCSWKSVQIQVEFIYKMLIIVILMVHLILLRRQLNSQTFVWKSPFQLSLFILFRMKMVRLHFAPFQQLTLGLLIVLMS